MFTCDEETGGRGATAFCQAHKKSKLPVDLDALKFIIEIDRRGSHDAVYYDCENFEFEKYITSKGFRTAYGSFSDISFVAPDNRKIFGIEYDDESFSEYEKHEVLQLLKILYECIMKTSSHEKLNRFEAIQCYAYEHFLMADIVDEDYSEFYSEFFAVKAEEYFYSRAEDCLLSNEIESLPLEKISDAADKHKKNKVSFIKLLSGNNSVVERIGLHSST